jgi:hypothetical protein
MSSIQIVYPSGDRLLIMCGQNNESTSWIWRGHQKGLDDNKLFCTEKAVIVDEIWDKMTLFDNHKGVGQKPKRTQIKVQKVRRTRVAA